MKSKTPAKLRVILVDDDPLISSFYTEVMEENDIEVELVHVVSDFLARIRSGECWDIIVLDVMMPHPGVEDMTYAESDDGLLTGVLLIDRVRHAQPGASIEILTNRDREQIEDRLPEDVQIFSKFECPPEDFAKAMKGRERETVSV